MKLKELEKTVNLGWSPKSQYPILIAAGTAAQQVDASFSTNAELELYSVNLGDVSQDLKFLSKIKTDCRFHKLVWCDHGAGEEQASVIAGGCDSGSVMIYNTSKLLCNENDGVNKLDAHTRPVKSLDFNPFKKNLLASGSFGSEIWVWDMNQLNSPMSPGKATDNLSSDEIVSLAWNKNVGHILTTTYQTRCLVWDLRKGEQIMKLTDPTSKSRWRAVAWDPNVPTHLCLASEDDQYPVVQTWDLRYSNAPVKILEGHQKGVLSVSWCEDDPDLLISSGKDNKLIIWNPNTTSKDNEIVCNMPIDTQWNFEVNWCPRNPFLISTSSFDGRATIHTLSGGQLTAPISNKIADSFPGVELPSAMPNTHQTQQPIIELSKPPKWIKKLGGVSFGFGGKLVSFDQSDKTVNISLVVTEADLMMRYKNLEDILENGNIYAHCYDKLDRTIDPVKQDVWKFVASQFYGDTFKDQAITFLGYSTPLLNEKLRKLNIRKTEPISTNEEISNNSRIGPSDGSDLLDNLGEQQQFQNSSSSSATDGSSGAHDFEILKKPLKIAQNDGSGDVLCESLILGDIYSAIEILIHENKWTDALILASSVVPHMEKKIKDRYFKKNSNSISAFIGFLINKDWFNIVESCELSNWKQILITLLTYTTGEELSTYSVMLGQRLLQEGDELLKKNALICFVCAANVNMLVENWGVEPTDSEKIHELIELGLIMKEASQKRGISNSVSGALADVTYRYAELLASQGYLTAAYTYLGDSHDERIQELKERLIYALELKQAYPIQSTQLHTTMTSSVDTKGPQSQHSTYGSAPSSTPGVPSHGQQYDSVPSSFLTPGTIHSSQYNSSSDPNRLTERKPSLLDQQPLVPNNANLYPSTTLSKQHFNIQPATVPSSAPNMFPVNPTPTSVQSPFAPNSYPTSSISAFNPSASTTFTPAALATSMPNNYRPPSAITNPSQFQPVSMPPPTLPATPVSATPPPPPAATNSARQTPDPFSGQTSSIKTRGKYVADPSIQGGRGLIGYGNTSSYNQAPMGGYGSGQQHQSQQPIINQPTGSQYGTLNHNSAFQPPSSAFHNMMPQSDHLSGMSQPQTNFQPIQPTNTPQQSNFMQIQPNIIQPHPFMGNNAVGQQQTIFQPQQQSQQSDYQSAIHQNTSPFVPSSGDSLANYPPSFSKTMPKLSATLSPSTPGWNDPPPALLKPKAESAASVSKEAPSLETSPSFEPANISGQPSLQTGAPTVAAPPTNYATGAPPSNYPSADHSGSYQPNVSNAPTPSQWAAPPAGMSNTDVAPLPPPPQHHSAGPRAESIIRPSAGPGLGHQEAWTPPVEQQRMPPTSSNHQFTPAPPLSSGGYLANHVQPPQRYQQNTIHNRPAPPSTQWGQPNTAPPVTSEAPAVAAMAPPQKPPLPEEHIHLQTVLDSLREQCLNKTNNLQMKRKLTDVTRKLEMLYDAIRDNKLSPQTLDSLHKIITAIQHHNYQECLSLHTHLVNGPEFAKIASFMPSIKVLIQSALQLEIYL